MRYENAELEIVKFQAEDIIATSFIGAGGENEGEIDYIHDDDALIALAAKENAIGFLVPGMEKSQLFRGVVADGVLPRKTFSMGHSREKRYYLESRKIK